MAGTQVAGTPEANLQGVDVAGRDHASCAAQPHPKPDRSPVCAFIGLGANLGDAQAAVREAIRAIAALPHTRLIQQSPLYQSAPVDAAGGDFVNAVVQVVTQLGAYELLHALQNLEQAAGRTRPFRNAPRLLDLDVLLYGDAQIDSATLTVPHPRMWERAFVLVPLAQIAPERVAAAQLQVVASQVIAEIPPG